MNVTKFFELSVSTCCFLCRFSLYHTVQPILWAFLVLLLVFLRYEFLVAEQGFPFTTLVLVFLAQKTDHRGDLNMKSD